MDYIFFCKGAGSGKLLRVKVAYKTQADLLGDLKIQQQLIDFIQKNTQLTVKAPILVRIK